jgi:hypothetical protein
MKLRSSIGRTEKLTRFDVAIDAGTRSAQHPKMHWSPAKGRRRITELWEFKSEHREHCVRSGGHGIACSEPTADFPRKRAEDRHAPRQPLRVPAVREPKTE